MAKGRLTSMHSLEPWFRELGLRPSAGGEEIRRAFRRLAKAHHPDLQRGWAGGDRFVRIVQAYRKLREDLKLHAAADQARPCPQCGQAAELLEGLDGRFACIDCLLDVTRRRFLLPLPIVTTVSHTVVIVLEGVSVGCFGLAWARGSPALAAVSLIAGLAALALLAVTCLAVKQVR